jgi:hypothetical protein
MFIGAEGLIALVLTLGILWPLMQVLPGTAPAHTIRAHAITQPHPRPARAPCVPH